MGLVFSPRPFIQAGGGAGEGLSLPHTPHQLFHLHLATYRQARSLMDAFGMDIEDALFAVGGQAACLFSNERDRVGFVQQAQFTIGELLRGWVEEDATLEQRTVEVGYH